MAEVETVRGRVETTRLGPTLMHEHVFVLSLEVEQNWPNGSWDGERQAGMDRAIERLREVRAKGIETIVDLTVIGLGRYIPYVQRVNEGVDINILVATGLYTFDELPRFFVNRPPGAVSDGGRGDVMVDMFVRDIRDGIADTGVRAGVLKCCTDQPGVTPNIDRVLRAIAQAHRETGVPISTHTYAAGETGRDQQRIFAEEGVDLSRVVIGHSGDTTNIGYLRELMDNGSMIGMDRFGLYRSNIAGFDERIDTIAKLCSQGYGDRMVLSHDTMCHNDFVPGILVQYPDWTFSHISDAVLPALSQSGVSDADIHRMMVDNPRVLFERQGAY